MPSYPRIPRYWRLNPQRYAMVGEKCNICGVRSFPPRDICQKHTLTPLEREAHGHAFMKAQGFGQEAFRPYTDDLRMEEGTTGQPGIEARNGRSPEGLG